MSPIATYLVARERINDLVGQAEHAHRASEVTRSRRPSSRGTRTGMPPTVTASAVTLRLSRPADDRALEELAQLDCARPLHGPNLLAEIGGTLCAAISLNDGAVIAHPFHRTTAIVELLRAQANAQLSDQRTPSRRTPTSLVRRLVGKRDWLAAS